MWGRIIPTQTKDRQKYTHTHIHTHSESCWPHWNLFQVCNLSWDLFCGPHHGNHPSSVCHGRCSSAKMPEQERSTGIRGLCTIIPMKHRSNVEGPGLIPNQDETKGCNPSGSNILGRCSLWKLLKLQCQCSYHSSCFKKKEASDIFCRSEIWICFLRAVVMVAE